MSSQLKPIKVYGTSGPNPPKVHILIHELGLPSEAVAVDFADIKKPEYTAVNPNGRVPAIYDPNTDLTLWESGAILEYLVERYDTKHTLSFPQGSKEAYHAKQWLFFQTTGQGPYYGQFVWFNKWAPEKLPYAIDRYAKEINRITGVLEEHLSKQKIDPSGDGPWLVGGKKSYVDIAWTPWQYLTGKLISKDHFDPDAYPTVKKWLAKLTESEAVLKALTPPSE